MGLFDSKKTTNANYVGVDLGGSSIKMVELTNNNGRGQLVTYGYIERSLDEDKTKLIDRPDDTAAMIKKIKKQSKIISDRAITALPAPAVFSSIISLPEINEKKIYLQQKKLLLQLNGKQRKYCHYHLRR